MNRIVLATAFAGVLLLGAANDVPSGSPSLIAKFVKLYRSSDFAKAAQLFHCPPSYAPVELEVDRKAIETSLRIMSGLYGPVHSASESAGSVYVAPTTACGTAEYWKANPTTATLILDTEQRDSEQGYLVFELATINGQDVLFQFGHGLPATHPDARARAKQFLEPKLAK